MSLRPRMRRRKNTFPDIPEDCMKCGAHYPCDGCAYECCEPAAWDEWPGPGQKKLGRDIGYGRHLANRRKK